MDAMALAGAGLVTMALPVGLAWWMARRLRLDGESARPALHWLGRSVTFYFGLVLLTAAVSRRLGEVIFGALCVAAALLAVRQLPNIARAVRAFKRSVQRIGDPAAWRRES